MRTGFLLVAATAGATAAVVALDAGGAGPAIAAVLVGASGLLVVATTYAVLRRREHSPEIGVRFAAVAGAVGLATAAAAWVAVARRAEPSPDLVLLAAVLLSAVVAGAWAAYVVGMAVGGDVDRISARLAAVGEGDRTVRLDARGGDQVARLAAAGNLMIDQLILREAERDEAQRTRHELVRAMVDQLRASAAARDRAEEHRRQLFVGVSHDLRTPLTALQLLANAIRDELSPQHRAEYAERMLAQIASLTQLTEQVFELSRLEAGQADWSRVRMPVDGLIREIVEQMLPSAEARGVALVVDAPEDLPPVNLAPDRIGRVLVNLVQNALEHTGPDGRVCIAVRATDAAVEVDVSDTGTGIPPNDREHVFEAFYRGGAGAARSGSGTGLGLAISRAIVQAHGGGIALVDADRGSTFRFWLPR